MKTIVFNHQLTVRGNARNKPAPHVKEPLSVSERVVTGAVGTVDVIPCWRISVVTLKLRSRSAVFCHRVSYVENLPIKVSFNTVVLKQLNAGGNNSYLNLPCYVLMTTRSACFLHSRHSGNLLASLCVSENSPNIGGDCSKAAGLFNVIVVLSLEYKTIWCSQDTWMRM